MRIRLTVLVTQYIYTTQGLEIDVSNFALRIRGSLVTSAVTH